MPNYMHIIMCIIIKGNAHAWIIYVAHRAHYGIYIRKVHFYSDLRWLHTLRKITHNYNYILKITGQLTMY